MLLKNKRDSSTKRPDTKFSRNNNTIEKQIRGRWNQTGQHSLNSRSSTNYKRNTQIRRRSSPFKNFSQHPHRDIPCSPKPLLHQQTPESSVLGLPAQSDFSPLFLACNTVCDAARACVRGLRTCRDRSPYGMRQGRSSSALGASFETLLPCMTKPVNLHVGAAARDFPMRAHVCTTS